MKYLFLITLILFLKCFSFGQTMESRGAYMMNDGNEMPIFIVNDTLVIKKFNLFIYDKNSVKDFVIFDAKEAFDRFGDTGKVGAMVIELKAGIKIFNTTELAEYYKIDQRERNLPICINGNYVSTSKTLVIDNNVVKNVVIREGSFLVGEYEQSPQQTYIDIQVNQRQ